MNIRPGDHRQRCDHLGGRRRRDCSGLDLCQHRIGRLPDLIAPGYERGDLGRPLRHGAVGIARQMRRAVVAAALSDRLDMGVDDRDAGRTESSGLFGRGPGVPPSSGPV